MKENKSQIDIRHLHRLELVMLDEVNRICKDFSIPYFAIGGTALGAVRHSGFIPWDDDLDIGMLRENYDKFLRICEKELGSKFFLQTPETESNTPYYFAKLRLNGTLFEEEYTKHLAINHGIFIDIFPYDNIPDDPILRFVQFIKVKYWNNLLISKRTLGLSHTFRGPKYILAKSIRYVCRVIASHYSVDQIVNKLDKECTWFNDKETEYVCFVKLPFVRMKRTWVSSLEYRDFEDRRILCSNKVELYLRSQFGDYMMLPPKEKQVAHLPEVVDLGNLEDVNIFPYD